MSMSDFLSQYVENGEMAKEAQVGEFLKLAEENGIDINQLSDEEVGELYANTFGEEGAEEEDDDGDEEALIHQASAEFELFKEAEDKMGEAELMGRHMAHAYIDELEKQAKPNLFKAVTRPFTKLRKAHEAYGKSRRASDKQLQELEAWKLLRRKGRLDEDLANVGVKGSKSFARKGMKATGEALKRRNRMAMRAATAYGVPTGLAAAGGAGYLATRDKKSSAIDAIAMELAFNKVASVGWDPREAAERIQYVVANDMIENTKLSAANDLDTAVEIRALEIAETAGYPINWNV